MKIRILPFIAATMILAGTFMSSCLKNDYEEIEYPSASSIKSFSLGTLYQTIYKGGSKGQDTIDTISYAKYPFIIDQINRRIYNVDSLPKGVNISKAVASITADGDIVYKNKNDKDTLWTQGDTLDLTNGISLKVYTYSPVYKEFRPGKPYAVTVNVHKYNPDSLVWKHYDNVSFTALSEQKAVFADKNIYVFGKEGSNVKVYKLAVNKGYIEGTWEGKSQNLPSGININSALAYNNKVYYVAGGKLYQLGNNTSIGNLDNLSSLISVSNGAMLAYQNDGNIIAINETGKNLYDAGKFEEGEAGYDFNSRFFAISYPAEHNNSLWRTTVMSNNPGTATTDSTANVYSYISSDSHWIKMTPNNPATCPNVENISMIKYNGKLYAFGGKKGDKIKAFESFYNSDNNGFDWRKEAEDGYMIFDSEIAEYYNDKPYSCVVETDSEGKESFVWFVWYDGNVTRGHLNKFAPKN